MSKKSTKALASAALMSLVLTTALSAGPVKAAQGEVTRVSGADRYATASQVATTNWADGSDNVVLVSGEGYADAVSASALAKKLDAPILLTKSDSLSADAQTALETLKPKNIYVVGGTASISQSIRDELAKSYTLTELGGANRYETNTAVAEELVKLGVSASDVLVVGGEGFSDALSVAPVAAAKGQILLLANNNSSQPAIDFVKENNSKVTVVGTSNVINDTVYNALGATTRVDGGTDRFDTNLKVLDNFKDSLKTDKLYIANATAATPDDLYADALVASAVAGKYSAPLLLVDGDNSAATTSAIEYIKNNTTKSTDLQVIGGTGVVSEATVNAINAIYNPGNNPGNGENTVAEINPINLNQFEVVFNTNVDEDTAELPSNYKVAGTQLTDSNSHVELINDNTVRVTLLRSAFDDINQGDEKTVSVKKGILSEDKSQTIEKEDQKIEFKDVTAPTLESVSVRGNNKLVVEFSEAVNMGNTNLSDIKSLIQVNGKNLSNVDSSVTGIKEYISNGSDETWANKVEFYLNSGLKSGENTVKVKDASGDILTDAAGFGFKETEETVTVDDVSTKPEIQDITCTDDGELRIKFDRPIDSKTYDDADNYQINGKDIDGAKFELKDDDQTIKVTNIPDGVLEDDTNVLEVYDGLKDAYGNKIEDETRKSFDKEKDETKPTVLSANVIDSNTLRVQFSEDVKYSYATNLDNYELDDADDVDVTDNAKGIYTAGYDNSSDDPKDDTDTYDIKFDNNNKLTSSKYTLTVKNVVDKATDPNVMDDQTVEDIDGNDEDAPSVDNIEAFQKSETEVSIYFDKEMDTSSLNDKSNYYYINGDGDSEDLPDDVDIDVSDDNKGVVLDFDDANKTIDPTATSGDDVVKKIGIKSVADANGNEVYVGALTIAPSSSNGPKLLKNTFKLEKDGDDVKATFQLDNALDTAYESDFEITNSAGTSQPIVPDSADADTKTVTLTFNEGDNADAVLALGSDATLNIVGQQSEDIGGRPIQKTTTGQKVYHNAIAPETDRDNYSATKDATTGEVKVNVTLKTPVDTNLLGAYNDDFVITNSTTGKQLDVSKVELDGTTLIFTIADPGDVSKDDKVGITAATNSSDIDLRSQEDGDGNYVDYVPSNDDKSPKYVTVTATSVEP